MVRSTSQFFAWSSSFLGLGLFFLGSAAVSATPFQPTPAQTPSTQAQLFKRPPASVPVTPGSGCGPQGCRLTIDQNVLQPGDTVAAYYSNKDRQVIQTGETRNISLSLQAPVVNPRGQVVIPAESVIEGEIVPVKGGGQFIANRIVINGTTYTFAAESALIPDTKDPNQADVGAIATDAAIGAVGGILVGQVFGQRGVTLEQVLGGATAGVIVGNVTAPQAVVLNPGDKIDLKMTNNFRL